MHTRLWFVVISFGCSVALFGVAFAQPHTTYLPSVANPSLVAPTATTAPPTPTQGATPTPTRDPDLCAAEYPTVCIPPPPPDLNCSDIPYRRFVVLSPDRHHFDSDNDGIGCESD